MAWLIGRRRVYQLYEQMRTSVFERMSVLAAQHGAVNLGQGFPDFGWPPEILERAAQALIEGSNQYAPSRGLPQLRTAIAEHYNRHFEQALSAEGICVTSGATEALSACILATVAPGDEVIVFTPAYDSYVPTVRRAGGVVREVALQPPHWRIDRQQVEASITAKTKVIILNNPHNPAGRLYTADELRVVAELAIENDLTVITDEVWEHILLDGQTFTPLASLPGMAERTLKVGSAGKIFSLTGWKIGWISAAPALTDVAARAHQFLTFATAPNLQAAVAYGLSEGDAWLRPMRQRFAAARDRMISGLAETGYAVLQPGSTYFLCVDLQASGIAAEDEAFAARAVAEAGVAVVPLSAFAEANPPRHLVRLCFAKRDETIDAGIAAMERARKLYQ
jgi:aspartate/methionine/tyrosine aminotransferase